MPVSLNTLELGIGEASLGNGTSTTKRRLKTTNKMVEDALIQLHAAKGISLRQIYNFIMGTYFLESLTRNRVILIKKHLNHLRESEDIVNVTGKGLIGKFKLADKKHFIKKKEMEEKKIKEAYSEAAKQQRIKAKSINTTAVTKSKTKIKKATKKQTITSKPVIPRQVTPVALRNTNVSMFDTPMVATQVHASTPFVGEEYIPRAPEVNQRRVNRKKTATDDCATPRTSLPGKKRRLMKLIE